MDMAALGISSTDVEAYGRSLINVSALPDREVQRSYILSLAHAAEPYMDTEMMLSLIHFVDYVKLADPVYMLIGIFRLFPVGARCSIAQPPGRHEKSPVMLSIQYKCLLAIHPIHLRVLIGLYLLNANNRLWIL
ncbi:unnamed protein product [Aspergillus oryzae RIB40]|uniref:DNA, SC012 n=1 Tax=Aspergillus oryzae (strain ATCC 42149 / RIB 40) TaxID=510516 RepID=Q2UDS6_ASPOR|nr:unnamed protein product [Aspergillus oryzae RIB40]KOC12506.1 hypothetical protein AFLA70_192g002170 [Aspergillus flavus AF70]BAE60289.1 unnamed protein product [Aspergillus oryzae RIB40]